MSNAEMGVVRISRLSHWSQLQGMTADPILNCIDYIAKAEPLETKMSGVSSANNSETPDTTQTDT
jgi:hypothetical protein